MADQIRNIVTEPWRSYPDDPHVNVDISDSECYTHYLTGSDSCPVSGDEMPTHGTSELYFEIRQFGPSRFENIKQYDENEAGDRILRRYVQKRWVNFEVLINDWYIEVLNNFAQYQDIIFFNKDNGTPYEISDMIISEPTPQGVQGHFIATVELLLKNGTEVIDNCCGSAYENAPYEDGTTDPGDPGNEEPAVCDDYEIDSVTVDTVNKTITVVTTGGPVGGTEEFEWYFFSGLSGPLSKLSNTASILNYADAGTYRIFGRKGGCTTDPYDVLIQDDCTGYAATIQFLFGFIVVEPTRDSTVTWERDIGGGFVSIADTTLIIRPDTSGTYRANLTSGTCTLQLDIVVAVDDCAWITSISESNGVLTVDYSNYPGVNTPTFKWFRQLTDTPIELVGEVSDSLTVDEEGLYISQVIVDGCTIESSYLIIGKCVDFRVYIDYIKPNASNIDASASVVNNPDTVDYKWYQAQNGQWQQVGSGSAVSLNTEGAIKVVAKSDGCVKEFISQACVDPLKPEWEELHIAVGGETDFTPTEIVLDDPDLWSDRDYGARFELFRGGSNMIYKKHPLGTPPDDAGYWTVWDDGGTLKVQVNVVMRPGEVFRLVKRYIP